MCKKLLFLISVSLVLYLAGYALAVDGVIPTSGAPIIDGIKDPNWLISAQHKLLNISVNQDDPPDNDADLSCSWQGIWDIQYLYFFVDVNDDHLWNDSPAAYEDDSVEIMVDIGHDGEVNTYSADDYQYRVSWDATTPTIEEYYHGARSLVGVVYKLKTKAGNLGYTLEIKFPWSTLDYNHKGIYVNDVMGLEVQVNDDDDGGVRERQVAWINTENRAWQDPTKFGTVTLGPGYKACYPNPSNNATGVFVDELQWIAGLYADDVSGHKVYYDTDKALVDSRSLLCDIPGTSCTNPSYPIPALTPETTYYWAIDEVNVSGPPPYIWSGDTWKFTSAPLKAFDPDPYSGEQLVDLDADLFWDIGFYAKTHKVYLDTDVTLVNTRSPLCDINGVSCNDPCYPLPALETKTTYYWAIDEVNGTGPPPGLWSGDTWNFKTVPEPGIGHILCEVWKNITGADVNSLRNDPRYPDSPTSSSEVALFEDPTTGENFGTRMHGWLYIYPGDMNDYTFWIASNEQSELWLSTDDDLENAVKIASVSSYTGQRSWDEYDEQQSPMITYLTGGNLYYIMALHKEEVAQDHMAVGWSTTIDPNDVEVIPGKNLIPFIQKRAFKPIPKNGATDVKSGPTLSWSPGMYAVKHDVYFGTNRDNVKGASRSNPLGVLMDVNIPRVNPTTTYNIVAKLGSRLAFDTTYYWRIDDVNENTSPYIWKGQLWSFKTGKYHVVEDFEKYANTTALKLVWHPKTPADANTSSDIKGKCGQVHNGTRAMALKYSNTSSRSEVYADSNGANSLGFGFNWRLRNVKALSLWLHGIPDLRGSKTGAVEPYTLKGDGTGLDDNTTYDVFYYLYTQKAGQMTGQVTAKIDSIDNTDPSAMAGVMIRGAAGSPSVDGIQPGANYAAVVVTPDKRILFMARVGPRSASKVQGTVTGINLPHWVRITQSAQKATAEHSADGTTWLPVGTALQTSPMSQPLYVGLCVTSNVYGEMCEAVYSSVQMQCPLGTNIADPVTTIDMGNYVYNDPEAMYVVLQDNDSNGIVYYENKDDTVTQTADWMEWRIDMNEFIVQGVDPCNVRRMYIGVGDKNTPSSGSGRVYVDDIALYAAEFYPPECPPLPPDLVRDGKVDYKDLKVIANNWLIQDYGVSPQKPDANCLVAWYRLERDPCDSAGPPYQNGVAHGIKTANYVTDRKEGSYALDLKGDANYIGTSYDAAAYGIEGKKNRTITAWAKARTFDADFRGLYEIGGSEKRGQDFSMLTSGDEPNVWRANHEGGPATYDIDFAYPSLNKWVHLAHSYDGTTVKLYADGNLVATRPLDLNTTNLKTFSIGHWTSWGDYYFDGIVDDVRIYNCALSQDNIAYIAHYPDVNGFTQPLEWLLTDPNADLYYDQAVTVQDANVNVSLTNNSTVNWSTDVGAYNNGTWYYYPNTNWWNVWFFNYPYKHYRWKMIELELTIQRRDPNLASNATIMLGGSTGAWELTANGTIRPPLPSDVTPSNESLYIDRAIPNNMVFNSTISTTPRHIKIIFIIKYNPRWVFIDIRGDNFKILPGNGRIKHRCIRRIIDLRDVADLSKHWGQTQVWPTWVP